MTLNQADQLITRYGLRFSCAGGLIFPRNLPVEASAQIRPFESVIIAELKRRAAAERVVPLRVHRRQAGAPPVDHKAAGLARMDEAAALVAAWKRRGMKPEAFWLGGCCEVVDARTSADLPVPARLRPEVLALIAGDQRTREQVPPAGLRLDMMPGGAA